MDITMIIKMYGKRITRIKNRGFVYVLNKIREYLSIRAPGSIKSNSVLQRTYLQPT